MERRLADLSLEESEEDVFPVQNGDEAQDLTFNFCLVGCFLTASVVHFPAIRNTMINIWHPWKVFKFQIWVKSDFCSSFLTKWIFML